MKPKNSLTAFLMVFFLFVVMIVLSIGLQFLSNDKQIQETVTDLGSINNYIDLSDEKNHHLELVGKDGDLLEKIELKHQFKNFNKTEGELLQHYKPEIVARKKDDTIRNGELITVKFTPRNEDKLKSEPAAKEYEVGRDVYSFIVKSLDINDQSKDILKEKQDLNNPYVFILHSDYIYNAYGNRFEKEMKQLREKLNEKYTILNKEENISFNDYAIAEVDELLYPEAKSIQGFGRMYEFMVRNDEGKVIPLILDFRVENMDKNISNQRDESGRIVYGVDSDIKVYVKSNLEVKDIGIYEKTDIDDDVSQLIDGVVKEVGEEGGIVLMPIPVIKKDLMLDLLD